MATGIVKIDSKNLRTVATLNHKNPYNLSGSNEIEISYKNKIRENEILKPIHTDFISISNPNQKVDIRSSDLILGSNIFALHKMIQQGIKVDLIYLDPPYNTGSSFESRDLELAYADSFSLTAYLEEMRISLVLLRELLSDTGSIYLHIGHQMMPYLKILMDEIFGAKNLKNIITRRKCSSKNFTKNQYANLNDFILFYTKSNFSTWNLQGEAPSDEWIKKEYPKTEEDGRKYKLVPIHAPGQRNGATGSEWRGMLPPKGKHWQYTPNKLDELDSNNEIHWSKNGNPRRKVFLTKDKMLPYTDYWANFRDAHHQSIKITGYPTEKNLDLLKLIINASSNVGDLVLDPFCGSGTTVQGALELDRRWIAIDQSFTAIKYTIERLTKEISPMGDYVNTELNSEKNNLKEPHTFRLITDIDIYNEFKNEIVKLLD